MKIFEKKILQIWTKFLSFKFPCISHGDRNILCNADNNRLSLYSTLLLMWILVRTLGFLWHSSHTRLTQRLIWSVDQIGSNRFLFESRYCSFNYLMLNQKRYLKSHCDQISITIQLNEKIFPWVEQPSTTAGHSLGKIRSPNLLNHGMSHVRSMLLAQRQHFRPGGMVRV